jgi:DNA-binding MarR family transcriptional regulator
MTEVFGGEVSFSKYDEGMDRDRVDELVEQWRRERPDLDPSPMGLVGRLGRTHLHMTRRIEAIFAEHGLSIGEFDVLAALRRSGTPYEATPGTLARGLMLSPAGMTSRLDSLERAELIERRASVEDRRSSLVALTPAGLDLVDRAVAEHLDNERRLLAGLNRAEQRTLDQLLRKLLRHLDAG